MRKWGYFEGLKFGKNRLKTKDAAVTCVPSRCDFSNSLTLYKGKATRSKILSAAQIMLKSGNLKVSKVGLLWAN